MRHIGKAAALLLAAVLLLISPAGAAGDELRLPASLKVVEAESFAGLPALESVILPHGILRIERRAFAGSGLTEIYLPAGMEYIADDAFKDSGLQTVRAIPGSYAWEWAVRNGYITIAEPLTATVSCDAASARVGDSVTWTAHAEGGLGDYRCGFSIYLDDALIAEQPLGESDSFTLALDAPGLCRAVVRVTDGDAAVTAESVGLEILPATLAIAGLDVERADFIGAETQTWRASAEGGRSPYRYRFALKRNGETLEIRDYSDSDAFSYTFFESGTYVLTVQVKDADGTVAEESLSFTPTPQNLSVRGTVRIFITCDRDGNILRSDKNTGHYELQLSSGKDQAAFDDHVFVDPVVSFGSGAGGAGVVTIYDGAVVPYTGCLLYTFEFTTLTGKVGALLYDKLRDTYLDTDSEVEKSYGYAYDVTSGPFVKYRISTSNCFTALAAWCDWLGYGKLSDIVEASASYTDYLAWRMFDRFGDSWQYVGQY